MPTQRKNFGRRGLRDQRPTWQRPLPGPAYAGAVPLAGDPACVVHPGEDDDVFSAGVMVRTVLKVLFDFDGRLGLAGYWGIGCVRFVVTLLVSAAFYQWTGQPDTQEELVLAMSRPGLLVFLSLFLALALVGLSCEIRRFHDRDVSGLWILTWFIPIIGVFFALVHMVKNWFFPGTVGPNTYGA